MKRICGAQQVKEWKPNGPQVPLCRATTRRTPRPARPNNLTVSELRLGERACRATPGSDRNHRRAGAGSVVAGGQGRLTSPEPKTNGVDEKEIKQIRKPCHPRPAQPPFTSASHARTMLTSSLTAPARAGSRTRLSVRASAAVDAPPAKAAFVPPPLDPNTPSPIFGGSTGGLLRKAQVSASGRDLGVILPTQPGRCPGAVAAPAARAGRRHSWRSSGRAWEVRILAGLAHPAVPSGLPPGGGVLRADVGVEEGADLRDACACARLGGAPGALASPAPPGVQTLLALCAPARPRPCLSRVRVRRAARL